MTDLLGRKKTFMVVGANHRSSTMVFRDKLAIKESQMAKVQDRLFEAGVEQSFVLSANDRTEIYVCHDPLSDPASEIIKLLSAHAGVGRRDIEAQTYVLTESEAIKHLFAVCCALDSLVIGDPRTRQFLTSSYNKARLTGMLGVDLSLLIDKALAASKRVLRETEISRRPVSIPAAATQVARDLHGDLAHCYGLLIGAGEMGEMLATSLFSAGLSHLVVTHPNLTTAETLGQQLNCHVGSMEELPQLLAKSDIVLTSVNSRRFTLTRDAVKAATTARRRKPILLIDTGVPGDIDYTTAELEDAFLYSLDDMERVTREGMETQEAETEKAWNIVNEEVNKVLSNPQDLPYKNDGRHGYGSIEDLRQEALAAALGDADKATRLFLQNLERHGSNLKNFSNGELKDPDR